MHAGDIFRMGVLSSFDYRFCWMFDVSLTDFKCLSFTYVDGFLWDEMGWIKIEKSTRGRDNLGSWLWGHQGAEEGL